MFSTTRQAAKTFLQQGAAFGLAAAVTLAMLGSVNLLAGAPAPDSLLASGNAQLAQARAGSNS